MNRLDGQGLRWTVVIVGGVVVLAAVAVAVQVVPELAPVRQCTRDVEELAADLPSRARRLAQDVAARLEQAKAAFHTARVESERALTAQFEEAKQRGSIPPL